MLISTNQIDLFETGPIRKRDLSHMFPDNSCTLIVPPIKFQSKFCGLKNTLKSLAKMKV